MAMRVDRNRPEADLDRVNEAKRSMARSLSLIGSLVGILHQGYAVTIPLFSFIEMVGFVSWLGSLSMPKIDLVKRERPDVRVRGPWPVGQ